MKHPAKQSAYSPSLLWVLPLACSIWIGLIVDGWFARPSVRNSVFAVVDPIFDVMLVPALTLLLMWFLLAPARMGIRVQVVLFVFLSSLPMAYFSQQRPGVPYSPVFDTLWSYTDRYYTLGTCGLPFVDALLAISIAAFFILVANRILSQVRFQRVPIESAMNGKHREQRLRDAFFSVPWTGEDASTVRRTENLLLIASGLWLLVLGMGRFGFETRANSDLVLRTGILCGSVLYLLLWVAGECRRPWRAFSVMALGMVGLSSLPQIIRMTFAFGGISKIDELLLSISSVLLSTLLAAGSLFLLTISNQSPRRTKKLPFEVGTALGDSFAGTTSVARVAFWATGVVFFGLFCGAAYWIPQNIDAEDLTDEEQLSFRDGWLAAKFLHKTNGERNKFEIARDKTTGVPTVLLKIPVVDEHWMSSIALVEQRAAEGDQCTLDIESPLTDIPWLENILRQGIGVTCSLDAGGSELSFSLMSQSGLRVRSVHNADLTLPVWTVLKDLNPYPNLKEIVRCRLPDSLPRQIGTAFHDSNALRECVVSEKLMAALTQASVWPRVTVALIDPQLPKPIDGVTLAKYVYHGEFLGNPPLAIPETLGLAPLFVPVYADQRHSRLELSMRPMLLNAKIAEVVQTSQINIPSHLGFAPDGKLTELGVKPTRDCPAAIPWVTLPDVAHLFVNLEASTFDSRRNANESLEPEEIGFQPTAFPKLTRVTIYAQQISFSYTSPNSQPKSMYNFWDPRFDKFLKELLQHPGLVEVNVECRFNTNLWNLVVESKTIERLVFDLFCVNDLEWMELLQRFPRLNEVIVKDQWGVQNDQVRMVLMQAYMAKLKANAAPATTEEGETGETNPDKANEEVNDQMKAMREWMLANAIQPGQGRGGPVGPVKQKEPEVLEGEALDQAVAEAERKLLEDWTKLIHSVVPHVQVKVVPSQTNRGNLRWP